MKRPILHFKNSRQLRLLAISLCIILIGAGGTYLLQRSQAAVSVSASEAENGTVQTPAKQIADTSASSSKAVQFTGTPTISAACATGGAYLWANLETCGWPGPGNTGYSSANCPNGLTNNTGALSRSIRITTANTTIRCQNITGCISIEAMNVTVVDSIVRCNSGKTDTAANGTAVIYVDQVGSATIQRVETNGDDGVHACIWHQGVSLTVKAVNCHGANDGIFSWAYTGYSQTTGDNFNISDSYLHDFTGKTANGHVDGYQTEGAGNGVINHNTFLMTSDIGTNDSNAAVAIWNERRDSHDIAVTNNLIAGGGFSIYAHDYSPSDTNPAGGYSVTNITFTNNKFSQRLFGCIGVYGVWFPRGAPTDQWRRSGNSVLETGVNIDNGNPSYGGRTCL